MRKTWFIWLFITLVMVQCVSDEKQGQIDTWNAKAYALHYVNLDEVEQLADSVLKHCRSYNHGRAEALNNRAFVEIARMQYDRAKLTLDTIERYTSDATELALANIQLMRLCQRQSKNKEFYIYKERAEKHLTRCTGKRGMYARSEYQIVLSTYYYYVGQYERSRQALYAINEHELNNYDTLQTMAYWYNMGSGGMVVAETPEMVSSIECDYLLRCYKTALRLGSPYFEAQALQGLSEHALASQPELERIERTLYGTDHRPEGFLAGEMAERSLALFEMYGDVYQIAGGARTLAKCFWHVEDYAAAIDCLEQALMTAADKKHRPIEQAPDLVASIREQLTLAYSAVGDNAESLRQRNIYLNLQEETRQDRENEARADELMQQSRTLNGILIAIAAIIGLLVVLLFVFDQLRRRTDRKYAMSNLLAPLQQWTQRQNAQNEAHNERLEQTKEAIAVSQQQLCDNKRQNLEQRAKVSLVGSMLPLIDRMHRELHSAKTAGQAESLQYVAELANEIERNNQILTDWIQLRKGKLNLRIESFPMQQLFDILSKSQVSFQQKDITFSVEPTTSVVKADKVLTLFMINTMADNARKFTSAGGSVTVTADEQQDFVEISIADTGQGMDEEQTRHVFDHNVDNGHGFGLMNCKGIIEQYKKVSQLFSVAAIGAESRKGQGSRFFFRLPKGILRLLLPLLLFFVPLKGWSATSHQWINSLTTANKQGHYEQALAFADSCIAAFNEAEVAKGLPMRLFDEDQVIAELRWYEWQAKMDYNAILRMRNEVAIAALGLHEWELYNYNNRAYTHMLRQLSADNTLDDYVRRMRETTTRKNVAIIVLSLLLFSLLPAYYFGYYRHRKVYVRNVNSVKNINDILLNDDSLNDKLAQIKAITASMPSQVRHSKRNEELSEVVRQIESTLESAVVIQQEQATQMEMSQEENQRINYEKDRLYVANSVIDNCLSTLKHETMYYPSRIKRLIEAEEVDMQSLTATVDYYRELYMLLFRNAEGQTRLNCLHHTVVDVTDRLHLREPLSVVADKDMVELLFSLLTKHLGQSSLPPQVNVEGKYVTLTFTPAEKVDADAPAMLTDSLYCRQIVRDMGEVCHARRCGIQINRDEEKHFVKNIQIILVYHGQV